MANATTYQRALVAPGVLEEERWAYDARVQQRLTYREMEELSARPRAEGGLGRRIALSVLNVRVRDFRKWYVQIEEETREELRSREVEGMDVRQRAHATMLSRIDRDATMLAARRLMGRHMTVEAALEECPEVVVLRDERIILAALQGMERVAAERRKLLGLDAPIELKAEVNVNAAATEDLAKALAEAGIPVEVES
jgi:hypothetical protein